MRAGLSASLLSFGYKALNATVIGTIVFVFLYGEALRGTFPSWAFVPLLLVSAGGILISMPLFVAGFVDEFGAPLVRVFRSRKGEMYDSERLTQRGQELATRLGIRTKIQFKFRTGLKTAYSIPLDRKLIIGDVLARSEGELDATTAHELVHFTKANSRGRISRVVLYFLPFIPLYLRDSWLPLQILLPFMFALFIYPMKYASYWGEYHADEGGARITSPENMIEVLLHLQELYGDGGSFTHPSISQRIRRLQKKFGQTH